MPWSFYAGRKAWGDRPSSRVRVYERSDSPGRIYMSRAWITTSSGEPEARALRLGMSRDAAENLAKRTALAREQALLEDRTVFGEERAMRLKALLEKYHESKPARGWSASHRREQKRCREFWLGVLGLDTPVTSISPAKVEREAAAARDRNGWSARTEEKYLKYLKAATRWGWRKLRAYDVDPMMAVDLPEVRYDTSDRIYSAEEIRKLLAPHPDVDWRVTLAANIAADTGRRIGAIRQLRTDDLAIERVKGPDGELAERLVLHFRAETEKTRRGSRSTVSVPTAELIANALEREDVQEHGQLFPGGDQHRKSYWKQPVGSWSIGAMLKDAEDSLGIEHVERRGWHGVKRRHVTVAFDVSAGDATLVGDTTGNVSAELLRNVYRQQDLGRVSRHVDRVRAAIEGSGEEAGGTGRGTREESDEEGSAERL